LPAYSIDFQCYNKCHNQCFHTCLLRPCFSGPPSCHLGPVPSSTTQSLHPIHQQAPLTSIHQQAPLNSILQQATLNPIPQPPLTPFYH
jgi:hypothetical protein